MNQDIKCVDVISGIVEVQLSKHLYSKTGGVDNKQLTYYLFIGSFNTENEI